MNNPQNKFSFTSLARAGTDVLQESGKRTIVVIVNVMAIIPLLLAFIMGQSCMPLHADGKCGYIPGQR
jgi:hypothetical protein